MFEGQLHLDIMIPHSRWNDFGTEVIAWGIAPPQKLQQDISSKHINAHWSNIGKLHSFMSGESKKSGINLLQQEEDITKS